ncbi:MAG: alcohol dehydrogenase catalytic domain-containing protein, partial [Spirochaetales bacterium]
MTNQTAYLEDTGKISVKESKMPNVGVDDALVKISHVTICGSDVHFFEDPTFGGIIKNPKLPIVLGHECAGTVEAVGKNVTHLKIGDKVAIEPGIGCGTCSYCLEGYYNLCRKMDFMAAPPFNRGALSRYVSHPAKMIFPLPNSMNTIEGALIEPLSVGMHAVKRSGARLGMKAVVLGSGCIGLMSMASLKAMGVQEIIAVDMYDLRLSFARKMGASHLINAADENVEERVLALTENLG